MAMTADGKIATANRRVSSFGSKRDQQHLLELRAQADAVMAGARTVDTNPVTMGPGSAKYRKLRLNRGLAEYNLRIVVSRSGSLDPNAEIFRHRFSPVIVLTTGRADTQRLQALQSVADEVRICGEVEIDFSEAFSWLAKKWKVKRLLCEGGGELNDSLFRAGLVDELHLTVCPLIFGGRHAPTVADGEGCSELAQAFPMQLHRMERKGDELFLVYRAAKLSKQI